MCCKANKCIDVIEVVTSGPNVSLPENTKLAKKQITSIGLRKAASGQKSANGKTLAAAGVIATAHLKLVNDQGDFICNIPLGMLERDANAPQHLQVDWKSIGTTQSSIVLDTAASGYDATHVIELIFGYDCGPQCNP